MKFISERSPYEKGRKHFIGCYMLQGTGPALRTHRRVGSRVAPLASPLSLACSQFLKQLLPLCSPAFLPPIGTSRDGSLAVVSSEKALLSTFVSAVL